MEILTFFVFSKVSILSNTSKCEIAGTAFLEEVSVAPCMQYISLKKDSIKILGIHLLYNKKNFACHIAKNGNVLKLWIIVET